MLFFEEKGHFFVYEGFKVTAELPSQINLVTRLTLPLNDSFHEELEPVAKEPWYRRTNLTGLTLRCSTLDVRSISFCDGNICILILKFINKLSLNS